MSDNSKIIAYLDSSFRKNNIDKISYLFSPNFAFYVNGGDKQDLEEFTNMMKLVSGQIEILQDEMDTQDDIHFSTEFKLPINTENDKIVTMIGFIEVQIHNCMIEIFNLHYHAENLKAGEIREMIKNNNVAYV